MNQIPANPILEFNSNQMAEVRKLFHYSDISRLHQDINIFEAWIKMQHHFLVKEYDREYLERYLINSKGSIERAKKVFDKICTLRGLMPEYLAGYDIENEFQNFLKVMHLCALPKPTSEHNRIIFCSTHNPDTALFHHIDVQRYLLLIVQYLSFHDYNAGIEIVCDTTNFTLGIITNLNPITIANGLMIISEAIGLRMRGIHLINGSSFMDVMVAVVKQALPKKLTSRLYVHDNLESLNKRFSKNILPKDIGGDLDTAEQIVANNFKEFCSPAFIKQIKYIERAATDESKRLCSKFNEEYSGTPGLFKVLTVD